MKQTHEPRVGGLTMAELKAIAQVRAAAPELLAALKAVTDCLNEPGIQDVDEWKLDCKIATAKARAAIRRAEGGAE